MSLSFTNPNTLRNQSNVPQRRWAFGLKAHRRPNKACLIAGLKIFAVSQLMQTCQHGISLATIGGLAVGETHEADECRSWTSQPNFFLKTNSLFDGWERQIA